MGNTRNLGDLLNADSTIATADVADGGITTAKLADTAVTTAKITDANITTAKIASNAITTAKITDANISTAKLADDAVTGAKIENNPTIAGNLTVSGGFVPSTAYSNRNMITNGDMSVAQRGTSSTGQSSSGIKCVDQFTYLHNGGGTSDISQSSTAPNEFKNSLKVECNSTDGSLDAGDFVGIRHHIEAQNCQRLLFGTSSAKSITISFHVRSKQTGTYALNLFLDDDVVHFTKTYTISSADTFEKKTITFPANTSAVVEDDTGKGIEFTWWLRAGSTFTSGSAMTGYEGYSNGDVAVGHAVDFLDNSANEFYLTGVQVEIGDVATPFEYITFADNLRRCQRYYYKPDTENNVMGKLQSPAGNLNDHSGYCYFPVTMRATPTATITAPQIGLGDDMGGIISSTVDKIGISFIRTTNDANAGRAGCEVRGEVSAELA